MSHLGDNPYEPVPANFPAPTAPNHMALAMRTPLGRVALRPDGQFLALAQAAGFNPASFVLELAAVAARKPEILRCSDESVVAFLLDAAKLQLVIGRGIYPVPLKGLLHGWVGYKGAKELACRGGAIRDCWAALHFEGDDFARTEVPIPTVTRHEYGPHKGEMSKALGVYATLLYPGGRTRTKYFGRSKIYSYRNRNASHTKSDSPWRTAEEEMWMAKAILHTVGDLPHSSPELGHLRAMLEREETEEGDRALAAPAALLLGQSATPHDEDEDEPFCIVDGGTPYTALEPSLQYCVRGKDKAPQPLGALRNTALEAWLAWARGKLNEDPENGKLNDIATHCARVLEARRTGAHAEPPKVEAA